MGARRHNRRYLAVTAFVPSPDENDAGFKSSGLS
jgi:hypothetical protein